MQYNKLIVVSPFHIAYRPTRMLNPIPGGITSCLLRLLLSCLFSIRRCGLAGYELK